VHASRSLPAKLLDYLASSSEAMYVSNTTLWEIAIKQSVPRSDPMPFDADTACRHFKEAGYEMLDVRPAHAIAVGSLPNLHSDPFDRLLVAQAISEVMQFVTLDRLLTAYHPSIAAF
jgi:PIN domain nuclease of toxin-antitoxin system